MERDTQEGGYHPSEAAFCRKQKRIKKLISIIFNGLSDQQADDGVVLHITIYKYSVMTRIEAALFGSSIDHLFVYYHKESI